jgi:ribosomal protein S18 acetylase RimI-like enzyme
MRHGRPEDMPRIAELWRQEVAAGRQDTAPSESRMQAMLTRFDWESKSRVIEDGGRLVGAVVVTARPSTDGVLATLYPAGRGDAYLELVRWGTDFARAAGASIIQTYVAKSHGDGLRQSGLQPVRPWWRMDRSLDGELPEAAEAPGYEMIDASSAPAGSWEHTFNRSFADHWRFVPRGEAEIIAGKPAALCLMAVTVDGRLPAAIAFGELEEQPGDPRPQPVGLISSVGTVPEHRRRGLARWLVREVMRRLRQAGARHASLYVDGLNAQRAPDLYRKLGFEVAYEAEVWEATSP